MEKVNGIAYKILSPKKKKNNYFLIVDYKGNPLAQINVNKL